MTIYNWKIVQLDRKTADGFVTTAHWCCNATETVIVNTDHPLGKENTFSASAYGTCGFDGELTTPYADLTEEQVLGWVWASVDKDATEANLAAQIEAKKNPVSATGVPW